MRARKITLVERAPPKRFTGIVTAMKESFGFIERADLVKEVRYSEKYLKFCVILEETIGSHLLLFCNVNDVKSRTQHDYDHNCILKIF